MVISVPKKWLHVAGFVIGISSFVFLFHQLDMTQSIRAIGRIGWLVVPILLLTLPKYWLYAWSWQLIINRTEHPISVLRLFLLKLIGETLNDATPLNFLGGDPVRIKMLADHLPTGTATTSVIIDRMGHMISGGIIMLLGGVFFMTFLSQETVLPFTLSKTQTAVILSILIIAISFLWKRYLSRTKARLFHKYLPVFIGSVMINVSGRLISILEIYFIARFIDFPLTFTHATILSALSLGLTSAFSFVPSAAGVLEGGFAAYFAFFHWAPEQGLAIELIRRMNGIFWILCGSLASLVVSKPQKATPL